MSRCATWPMPLGRGWHDSERGMNDEGRNGEAQYLDILRELLEHGIRKDDRTGTGTRALFGRTLRFDLSRGFPLLTTKRIHVRSVVHELLWFLSGDTNVGYLQRNGVTIWDEWANPDGDLGPVYGKQWRSWEKPGGGSVDQVSWVLDEIRRNPSSRRLVVSAWNPADLHRMALAPCHLLFQFAVNDGRLDCMLIQRSGDWFLGIPFNVASYALLTCMVAQAAGLRPGTFVHVIGDAHLYENHLDAARTQLARSPTAFPTLRLNPDVTDLFAFGFDDVSFEGYQPQGAISAPVAV